MNPNCREDDDGFARGRGFSAAGGSVSSSQTPKKDEMERFLEEQMKERGYG